MTNIGITILILSLTVLLMSCSTKETQQIGQQNLSRISAQEFRTLIELKGSGIILDIRTEDEFNQEHIEGSTMLDYYSPTFRSNLALLDKSTTYYIYCRSGHRSENTLRLMKELGFKKVYELEKGINEWKELNYSTIK